LVTGNKDKGGRSNGRAERLLGRKGNEGDEEAFLEVICTLMLFRCSFNQKIRFDERDQNAWEPNQISVERRSEKQFRQLRV